MQQLRLLHTRSSICSGLQQSTVLHSTKLDSTTASTASRWHRHKQHLCEPKRSQRAHGTISSCRSSSSSSLGQLEQPSARHVCCRAAQDSSSSRQLDNQKFQGLAARLQQLSFQELQQLCEAGEASAEGHAAFSASFLFWLSSQEKQALGGRKQELANLAAQLVYLKEQADWEASRRLLPPLASSLAYSNYSSWQAQHDGQALPQVAPGVSIPDLYRAAEREEAKLKQWQSPQRPSSSLDSFAASSGYKQMAADAMARVRARLSGWEDDDSFAAAGGSSSSSTAESDAAGAAGDRDGSSSRLSPAAQQALQELLVGCSCREERATVLPEAFTPPGLMVSSASGSSAGGPVKVVTTPQRMLAAVQWRLQQLQQESSTLATAAAAAAPVVG
ncbi:hypothetical protein COO60DRAFT_207312 [Scenedesmus sp. NREL 46B-D3]|nr:hypothetical protein COO60DRAFT_207312 [Scenedesmus sp. NREL 46B-D3]